MPPTIGARSLNLSHAIAAGRSRIAELEPDHASTDRREHEVPILDANVDTPISTRVAHGRLSPSAAKIGANFGSTNIVMMAIAMAIATTTVIG